MSPSWRLYRTERGGHPAAIVFDEAAALDLNASALTHVLRYRLTLKSPRPDGLTSREEAEFLAALEVQFEGPIGQHGARLLGRITMQSERWIILMANDPPQPLSDILYTIARQAGYTPEVFFDPDPDKAAYWRDLYPNGEEFNMITDFDVLRTLMAKGDQAERVRPVDHSAYFGAREAADAFAHWASASQMTQVVVEAVASPADPDFSWHVRATHRGTMKPEEITAWSKAVYRKATELGGRYGGWETDVVAAP